jgi:hypothetical protein
MEGQIHRWQDRGGERIPVSWKCCSLSNLTFLHPPSAGTRPPAQFAGGLFFALGPGNFDAVPGEEAGKPAGNLPVRYSPHDPEATAEGDSRCVAGGVTQALVKLYYFHPFKPGIAKLRQSLIALVLDRRVDKQTQLRLFVNSVYLGNCRGKQIYGFSEAAQAYFGQPFSRLTRDQYLALVAMIVSPNGVNVLQHPAGNAARVRRIKHLLAGDCRPRNNGDVLYQDCR